MSNYLLAKFTYFTGCAEWTRVKCDFKPFPTPFRLHGTSCSHFETAQTLCLFFLVEWGGNTLQKLLTKVALAPMGCCAWVNLWKEATCELLTHLELLQMVHCTMLWAEHHILLVFPTLQISSWSVSSPCIAWALVLCTNLTWKYNLKTNCKFFFYVILPLYLWARLDIFVWCRKFTRMKLSDSIWDMLFVMLQTSLYNSSAHCCCFLFYLWGMFWGTAIEN